MNHKELIHYFLATKIKKTDRVLDMTCGNGHDTYFLASKAKQVYAIDIQKEAIESTKKRCKHFNNVKYYNMDHSNINFAENIDGAIYNLGYLPKGDKSIITNVDPTILSLNKMLKKGLKYLSIATYPGHSGGKEEYKAVRAYFDAQNIKYIELRYSIPNSPVSFLVDFKNPSSFIINIDELQILSEEEVWNKVHSIFKI